MASITRRGRAYQARIRRRGYATLTATFDTRREAETWVRAKERDIDFGALPETLAAQQTTLSDVLEDYRRKVVPLHRGAAIENKRVLAMMRHPLATLSLAEINAGVIEDYIESRLTTVSGSTVNRELSILSRALRRARKRHLLPHDPMADVDRPKNSPNRTRRLDPDERRRLDAALRRCRNPLFRTFVTLARESGMRRGELLGIEWRQVNLKQRVIGLRDAQTKNGQGRQVPLSRRATAALRGLRRLTGSGTYVFEGLTVNAVKLAWKRLRMRARLEDFRLHDLRHERVSSLVEAGWNVIEAMAVSGHKDMRVFRRYAHPSTQHLIDKLDQLAKP